MKGFLPMKFVDAVYGTIEIDNPVLLDLILSPPLQRLRKIDQAGFIKPFRPHDKPISRFDHSLGVCILLKQYKASLEEQIAGLIHDVSHTAFSHCADYLGSHDAQKSQSYQDDVFESFVLRSEIPYILKRHGLDVSYILDDTHFPLKETLLPNLCADRIDYSLRTALATNVCSSSDVKETLSSLLTDGSIWFFESIQSALTYASLFSELNINHYASLTSAVMLYTVGKVLRYSIDKGYLTYRDLFTDDETVLKIISQHISHDTELSILLDRMYNRVPYTETHATCHTRVFCKSRVVDPLCQHENKIKPLSFFHNPWHHFLRQESAPKSYCIQFDH